MSVAERVVGIGAALWARLGASGLRDERDVLGFVDGIQNPEDWRSARG